MANRKISELTTVTSLASADLFIITDDPGGTPASRAIRGEDLRHWEQTAAETSAAVTPTDYSYEPGNVLRYGADNTGITDSAAAFQDMFDWLKIDGGKGVVPPGDYKLDSQVVLDFYNEGTTEVLAYGATIYSDSLADVPFFFGEGEGQRVKRVISGLTVDHWGDTVSTGAFEISNAHNLTFRDCTVIPPDNPATGYAAWYYHQSDTASSSTGCFWNALDRCSCRGDTTPTTKSIAVRIVGSINALTIDGCNFIASSVGVKHETETGVSGGYSANALVICNTAFEGYDTAYQLSSANAATGSGGVRFYGNRFENGTTVYEMDAGSAPITTQPATPWFSFANYFVSDAGTYLSNSNSLRFNSLDLSDTPDGRVYLRFDSDDPAYMRNIKASTHTLDVRGTTAGYGLRLLGASDAEAAALGIRTGGGATLAFASNLGDITGINSLSGSGTAGQNLRGQETLSSGTAAVTFGTAEPDASYYITLSGDTNETFYWSSKATSGFTITSSNGSSTATVDWLLIR